MRIISRRALREFWEVHRDAEDALRAWYDDTRKETWATPADVKALHPKASIVGNGRVVFNIRGNAYRLIVKVDYRLRRVYVRFVGTHGEYDRVNAREV